MTEVQMNFPAAGATVEALDNDPRDRFVAVYEDVWQALKGTGDVLSVYMALKRRAGIQSKEWFGKRSDLAKEAGVSVNTFDRHSKSLKERGLLEIVARFVPIDWNGDPSHVSYERDDTHRVQIGNLYRVAFHLPPTQNCHRGYTSESGRGCTPELGNRQKKNLTEEEKDINNMSNSSDQQGKQEQIIPEANIPSSVDVFEQQFVEFWKTYPHFNKVTKAQCRKKLKEALKKTDFDTLMAGVRNFVAGCQRENTPQNFIAHPTTWLSQGRWELYQQQVVSQVPKGGGKVESKRSSLDARLHGLRVAYGDPQA